MTKPSQLFLIIAFLVIFGGCARLPGIGKTSIKAATPAELHVQLRRQAPELDVFRNYGPFQVTRTDDIEIALSSAERYHADLFSPSHKEPAPLVIFLHGYGATKGLHAYQAMHVASWGMLGLTIDLPNTGPWDANAMILARIVDGLARMPEAVDHRIDVNRIVLVGHSFGAASVAGALAEGGPAIGGILLDPAAPENGLPRMLARIHKPVMILGADPSLTVTKDRDYFYRFVPRNVFELSVRHALHEDAQFPSDDFRASEAQQVTFASALTAASLSLGMTGRLGYAWTSYQKNLREGQLFGAKQK